MNPAKASSSRLPFTHQLARTHAPLLRPLASAPARRHNTTTAPSEPFTPALPRGQSKVYDLALDYLQTHRTASLAHLDAVRTQSVPRSKLDAASVTAHINDPTTRRAFAQHSGQGHMDQPVFRHLAERAWVKRGGLDLLMQRVWQMEVIPDLLPTIGATSPLTISVDGNVIEAGVVVRASQLESVDVRLQLYHHPSEEDDTALYTVLMVDPDSPDHEKGTYTQRLHFLKTDIPLSVLSGSTNLFEAEGSTALAFEPPAPAKGSSTHRYVFLALRQPSAQTAPAPLERKNFNLRTYLDSNDISHKSVAGITLLRSEWTRDEDSYIREAYRKYRGTEMPDYGKPPKEMRYGYPLNAREARKEEIRRVAFDAAISEIMEAAEGRSADPQA